MGWIYHRCDTIQICSDWFDSGYWFLQSSWHRRMAESRVPVWMSPQLYFSRVQRGANCSVFAHVGRSSDLLPAYGDKASLLRWLSYYHPGFWSDADIIMVSGSNNSDSFYSVSLLVRWKLFSLHFGLLQYLQWLAVLVWAWGSCCWALAAGRGRHSSTSRKKGLNCVMGLLSWKEEKEYSSFSLVKLFF